MAIEKLLPAVSYKNASSERLREFYNGNREKHQLQLNDWFGAMETGIVVRLTADTGEKIDVTTHSGDLTQLRISASGEINKAYGMWKGEFEDHLLAPKYDVQLISYNNSGYPNAPAIDSTDFGGSDSI